jgi:hypothetical protein
MTDVRCRRPTGTGQDECQGGQYSDYIGQLQTIAWIRITDKHNGPSGTDSATSQDVTFSYSAQCAVNPAGADPTSIGGTCSVVTSAKAVLPGSITGAKRAVWHLDKIQVYDAGNDGTIPSHDSTLFAWQGLFTP